MKHSKPHFEHILSCMMNIRQFTQGIPDYDTFRKDIKTLRAVERELETMTQSIKDL